MQSEARREAAKKLSIRAGWTDERVKRVQDLWKDGLSAAQIARKCALDDAGFRFSRAAVLGQLHRTGHLRSRPAASAPRRAAALFNPARTKAPKKQAVTAPAIPLPPEPELGPGLANLETLGAHMCKWPIGDPQDPDFSYCGRLASGAYCAGHAAVAYVPPKASASANNMMRALRRHL